MKTIVRWLAVLAAFLLLPALANAADDPFVGTWSLNIAKSTLPAGFKGEKVFVFNPIENGILATETVTNAAGQKTVYTILYVYGGAFTPQTASPLYDAISVEQTDAKTLMMTFRLKGKVYAQAQQAISANGKEMSHQYLWNDSDPSGETIKYRMVFDRQ